MPAPTPRMTCRGIALPCPVLPCPRSRRGSGGCFLWLWLYGLSGQQPTADLAQRDRQRLFLNAGLDQRPDVLKQPLAQLSVVGVDLTGPLGGHDDQAVLAVHHIEQIVDRRVRYAFRGGSPCHLAPFLN